jgi:predicted RNase H-like HicB family nuclease/uncharacterized damage-inducible protein DinB
MPYLVCVEESGGRHIVHVPDLPGCFTVHKDREQALQSVPGAVESYLAWCAAQGLKITGLSEPMIVAEVIRSWESEGGYEVNAFFASDRPPLVPDEIPQFERLLSATRKNLLEVVERLDKDDLQRTFSGGRWSIGGVLNHVANAEWWYLDRLGLAGSRSALPESPFERLEVVRQDLVANLPALVNRTGVVTLAGETWSARKVLRRALWHERDHTGHIQKLRAQLPPL